MFNLFQDDNPRVMIDDVELSMFDLCVVGRVDIPTPERQSAYTENKFDYRGTKRQELGWKDIDIEMELNYLNIDDRNNSTFRKDFYSIRTFLLNAETLRFNDDLPVEYKVKAVKIADAKSEIMEHGIFKVTFTCDPFPYKNDDLIQLTLKQTANNTTVINDGNHRCFPIIKFKPKMLNGSTTYPTRMVMNLRPMTGSAIAKTNRQWSITITDFQPTVTTNQFVIDAERAVYYKTNAAGQVSQSWKGVEFEDFPSMAVGEYMLNITLAGLDLPNFELEVEIDRRLVY